MKMHILISIFENCSGGMPSRVSWLMPLTIPKPPEIQPPPGWQHCRTGICGKHSRFKDGDKLMLALGIPNNRTG